MRTGIICKISPSLLSRVASCQTIVVGTWNGIPFALGDLYLFYVCTMQTVRRDPNFVSVGDDSDMQTFSGILHVRVDAAFLFPYFQHCR